MDACVNYGWKKFLDQLCHASAMPCWAECDGSSRKEESESTILWWAEGWREQSPLDYSLSTLTSRHGFTTLAFTWCVILVCELNWADLAGQERHCCNWPHAAGKRAEATYPHKKRLYAFNVSDCVYVWAVKCARSDEDVPLQEANGVLATSSTAWKTWWRRKISSMMQACRGV